MANGLDSTLACVLVGGTVVLGPTPLGPNWCPGCGRAYAYSIAALRFCDECKMTVVYGSEE
jgi:hypothetical protein